MRSRRIVGLIGMLSVTMWSACSTSDAVESAQTSEPAPTEAASVVMADDIASDIATDSWARLPLPRREQLDLEASAPST